MEKKSNCEEFEARNIVKNYKRGKCGNCEWFFLFMEEKHRGQCRRWPPVMNPRYGEEDVYVDADGEKINYRIEPSYYLFPAVFDHFWCGEFEKHIEYTEIEITKKKKKAY
jgi:hypothetical protein